jgi:hypothetical protein
MAMVGAICAASAAMAVQLTPSPSQQLAVERQQPVSKPARKRVNRGLADSTPKWKRSRGAQAKPKRRRNLVTHSRRVRRKHRRARAA